MASNDPPISFQFRGKDVPVTYHSSVGRTAASMAVESKPFRDWVANISRVREGDRAMEVHGVEVQSVDMFGPRVGFVKLKSHCTLRDGAKHHTEHRLPGICLLRGGAVGILVALHCADDGETYSLLVEQPRVPIGDVSALELPAGMIDASTGTVKGVAAKEMEEECGIQVREADLVDLTTLAYLSSDSDESSAPAFPGIYPSPGGCDEAIRLMYLEKSVTTEDLEGMKNRLGGLREEGEIITLRVVKMDDVWRLCPDAKALCALFLLNQLRSAGKLPVSS